MLQELNFETNQLKPSREARLAIVFFIVLVSAFFDPCFAQDKPKPTAVAGAMALLNILLENFIPWVTGLVADTAILKFAAKLKLQKVFLTVLIAIVLGYPSIWFAFTAFVTPDATVAWELCTIILAVTLTAIKIIAYWVANEAFPSRKVSLLLLASAVAMTASALVVVSINLK